jgi:hypothetical protein
VNAQHVVVGCLFAVGALDLLHDAATQTTPSLRQTLGLAVAGLALTAAAGPAPQLAAGFALLLLVSSLYTVGLSTFANIGKALSP